MGQRTPARAVDRRPRRAGAAVALVRASLRGFSASPIGNVTRTLGAVLLVVTEAIGAIFLLDRAGGLGGWTTAEVVVLVAVAGTGLGIGMAVGAPLEPPSFAQWLRDGRFDMALTRPISPWLWVVVTDVQIRQLGRVVGGALVLAWAVPRLPSGMDPWAIVLLPMAVACMAVVVLSLLTAGAALTMWTVEGSEILNSFTYGGATLAGWPLQIYASGLRFVFLWIVPIGAAVYVPVLVVLDRAGPPGVGPALLPFVPLAATLSAALAGAAWRAGLAHHVGTGS